MKIVITTDDPNAQCWLDEAVKWGWIGYNCSPDCENASIKVNSVIAFEDDHDQV